ncbi:MAG: hypothetical protein HDR80_05535 [Bacteroides sp.]|nr:hypothetical protein [Bacteroides sp.]
MKRNRIGVSVLMLFLILILTSCRVRFNGDVDTDLRNVVAQDKLLRKTAESHKFKAGMYVDKDSVLTDDELYMAFFDSLGIVGRYTIPWRIEYVGMDKVVYMYDMVDVYPIIDAGGELMLKLLNPCEHGIDRLIIHADDQTVEYSRPDEIREYVTEDDDCYLFRIPENHDKSPRIYELLVGNLTLREEIKKEPALITEPSRAFLKIFQQGKKK